MKLNLKRLLSRVLACVMGYGIVLVAAMVLAPPAHGQSVPRPACYAMVNGVHVMVPRVVWGDQARHLFWACSPRGGPPEIYGFSCRHGHCLEAALIEAQNELMRATAKVRTADALWDQLVTVDCGAAETLAADTPDGAMCRERVALIKALGPGWLR
ncbi:hypothetical protein [Hydrogenophaga sp.]|uniref:hypothetical protein n=1 Tax=Hydrogenophaga sp. TaxID=1904254 RepID=UPI003D098472